MIVLGDIEDLSDSSVELLIRVILEPASFVFFMGCYQTLYSCKRGVILLLRKGGGENLQTALLCAMIYCIRSKKHDQHFLQQCCNHDTADVIQTICATKLEELLHLLHKGPLLNAAEGKHTLFLDTNTSSPFAEYFACV